MYRGKRALDLLLVALFSPLWLPLAVGVGLAVRWRLGPPVLFRQLRAGRDGRPFTILKFRTMITRTVDADGRPLSDAERLPAFGRRLRSTSLDELPELFNVIRGDMSLVGPRPLLVEYLPIYSAHHRQRHRVRPGLTGLAQISGRNRISWSDRLDLDVAYVRTASLRTDLRILAKTVHQVVVRHGISADGDATMPRFVGYDPHAPRE